MDVQFPTDRGKAQSMVSTRTVILWCIEPSLSFLMLVSSPPTYLQSEDTTSTIVDKEALSRIV